MIRHNALVFACGFFCWVFVHEVRGWQMDLLTIFIAALLGVALATVIRLTFPRWFP